MSKEIILTRVLAEMNNELASSGVALKVASVKNDTISIKVISDCGVCEHERSSLLFDIERAMDVVFEESIHVSLC